jgi:hypothetical protein
VHADGASPGRRGDLARTLAQPRGVFFQLGGHEYRLRKASERTAADEDALSAAEAIELIDRAPHLTVGGSATRLRDELERGNLVLSRVRPRIPQAKTLPPLPPPPPPAMKPPKPTKEGWLEIEIADEDGRAREGDGYRLELPDGQVITGTIGAKGLLSLQGVEPGTAKLTLTTLHSTSWSS